MRLLYVCVSISLALPGLSKLLHSIDELKDTNYDYVIAGAGTAGSVLASRLSEDGENRVLVVEAGVDNANIQNIIVPFLASGAQNTIVDWNFTTIPQAGMLNRTIPLPRGHVLGGSSSINIMVWNRGSNDLWDDFARLSNDSGWSWDSVAKYNLKTSRLVPPTDGRDTTGQVIPSAHGNGPVQTSLITLPMVTDDLAADAAKSLGGRFKFNEDMNTGDMTGLGYVQSSVGHGERSSAATAYLVPALNRTNLDVLINTRALKVYSSQSPSSGIPTIDTLEVAQSADGSRVNVTAAKEIILSGGVFGTPQILLLSGIGPQDELSKLDLPVLVDSPDVGQHLTEHPLLTTYFEVDSNRTLDPVSRNATLQQELLQQWQASRTGLMANPAGGSMIAFLKNPPDFFDGFDPSSGPGSGNTEIINGFAPGIIPLPQNGSYLTLTMAVVSPTSRGTFTLNSTNPFNSPTIDPQLYATDYDIQSMVQVMKDAETFVSQPPWDEFVVRPFIEFANDEEREIFARNTSRTVNHCIGTARMGPGGVEGGVVDSELRVKGVKGLRVVDASIFPRIPENHPQAVVYIVAERASDLIRSSDRVTGSLGPRTQSIEQFEV
ncbi:hypothetical protein AAF712_008759 [Marasmius tenuissimus]|uniref:Aryl-alcohol oxidase n=1 Tax=Marasmius tenuissimus TaxID=585030 RepID=A0ABR2ZSC6_9AGAR